MRHINFIIRLLDYEALLTFILLKYYVRVILFLDKINMFHFIPHNNSKRPWENIYINYQKTLKVGEKKEG